MMMMKTTMTMTMIFWKWRFLSPGFQTQSLVRLSGSSELQPCDVIKVFSRTPALLQLNLIIIIIIIITIIIVTIIIILITYRDSWRESGPSWRRVDVGECHCRRTVDPDKSKLLFQEKNYFDYFQEIGSGTKITASSSKSSKSDHFVCAGQKLIFSLRWAVAYILSAGLSLHSWTCCSNDDDDDDDDDDNDVSS